MFDTIKAELRKSKETYGESVGGEPQMNVPYANIYKGIGTTNKWDKKQMMDYAKRNPVVIGIVKAIATDIVTRVRFKALDQTSRGRPAKNSSDTKEEKAYQFSKEQLFKQKLLAAVYDWLISGEGYLWHGGVKKDKVKDILIRLNATREDIDTANGVVIIKHVASSTMTPKYDEFNIIGYEQQVNSKLITRWTPDNIIHAKFMDLDGRPEGFTPLMAARPMVETLGLIIDYAGNWFDRGGLPEVIFKFPKETANSENFKRAKSEVKTRFETNKRGHMFFAGEVEVDKINDWNKDMEFRQLFIMYVGSIAFTFNMPLHRIQSILGGEMSSGAGSSDLSDSGYWRSIYEAQDYWELLLNTGFWNEEFGVDMEFERTYLQDQFRETQATNMGLSNVEMLEKLGMIKPEFKKEVYSTLVPSIDSSMINEDMNYNQTGMANQGLLPDSEVLRGQATERFANEKRNEAGRTSAEKRGM